MYCKDSDNDNHDFVKEINLVGREFKVIPGTSTKYGGYDILVDKDTRVQYLINYQNGTEVIVDAEGKPILYEGGIE